MWGGRRVLDLLKGTRLSCIVRVRCHQTLFITVQYSPSSRVMKTGLGYESSQLVDLRIFMLSDHLLKTQWLSPFTLHIRILLHIISPILNSTEDYESIYFLPICHSFLNQKLLHAFYMAWTGATLLGGTKGISTEMYI